MVKGWGPKSSVRPLKPRETQLFGRIFAGISRGCPKRLRKIVFRNQEKGVLAKGVSAESSVTPKETKIPGCIGPSSTFGTQSATGLRVVHFWKKKTF